MCHCEGAKRPWQSASPVPLAPLPKGGWHGEAVTGGFFSHASCNPFVGAGVPDGPTGFFPHPRQGTRALPYKVLRYRARTPLSARSLK